MNFDSWYVDRFDPCNGNRVAGGPFKTKRQACEFLAVIAAHLGPLRLRGPDSCIHAEKYQGSDDIVVHELRAEFALRISHEQQILCRKARR